MIAPRSYLFVPGDSARKIEKAVAGDADALILDLEDAVAPSEKDAARAMVRDALGLEGRPQRWVRVNAFSTGLTERDLAAVMGGAPHGVVLPKYEGPPDLERLGDLLSEQERHAGLIEGSTRILAIISETAAGLLSLMSERPRHERLSAVMWGAEDLAQDVGALANRDDTGAYTEPFRLARTLCLFSAAASGVQAVDSVYTRIDDLSGLSGECRAARRDGFGAKAAIHPGQVSAIHDAFTPTDAERAWAERVIEALADGEAAGVVRIDGEMIDRPHLLRARRILGVGA